MGIVSSVPLYPYRIVSFTVKIFGAETSENVSTVGNHDRTGTDKLPDSADEWNGKTYGAGEEC